MNLVGVVAQLTVSVPLSMYGDQHGNGIAEIGIHNRPHHAVGELGGANQVHFMAQLCPELVGVFDVVLKLDIDNDKAWTACRIGLFLPHLGKFKNMLLKGFRYFFFHLLGSGSGIHRGHDSGSDRNRRVFRPRHFQERMNTYNDDYCRQYDGN